MPLASARHALLPAGGPSPSALSNQTFGALHLQGRHHPLPLHLACLSAEASARLLPVTPQGSILGSRLTITQAGLAPARTRGLARPHWPLIRHLRAWANEPSLLAVALSSSALMMRQFSRHQNVADPAELCIMPRVGHILHGEFNRADELIRVGTDTMEASLDALRDQLQRASRPPSSGPEPSSPEPLRRSS